MDEFLTLKDQFLLRHSYRQRALEGLLTGNPAYREDPSLVARLAEEIGSAAFEASLKADLARLEKQRANPPLESP
jgi:hypothetical protein